MSTPPHTLPAAGARIAVRGEDFLVKWYDAKGDILSTYLKGLFEVGVDRKCWNEMRNTAPCVAVRHVIDPKKSEMYEGEEQVLIWSFERGDWVRVYGGRLWHYEKALQDG